jgi:hypothetical protein
MIRNNIAAPAQADIHTTWAGFAIIMRDIDAKS